MQKDIPEEERERRSRDYNRVKKEVKRLLSEARKKKDEKLGKKVK